MSSFKANKQNQVDLLKTKFFCLCKKSKETAVEMPDNVPEPDEADVMTILNECDIVGKKAHPTPKASFPTPRAALTPYRSKVLAI
jgi:hypothetical protein